MIGSNTKLYTWVDIQDIFIAAQTMWDEAPWPKGVSAEIRQSGFYLHYPSAIPKAEIEQWLKSVLPPNAVHFSENEGDYIILETMGNGVRRFPIWLTHLDSEGDELPHLAPSPSFARPSFLQASPQRNGAAADSPPAEGRVLQPQVIAAHSFKGGVGRTLHALALAEVLSTSTESNGVLLVDGDFEAPGITWMSTNPEIAFTDLINLVHSSENPDDVVQPTASALRNQQKNGIYFMPAFRTDRQFRSLAIKPEHLFNFMQNKFLLTDILVKIGHNLGVSHVIIDLRAGVSELASNWLLDGRVAKIVVTTLSSQSVEGILTMNELLLEHQNRLGSTPLAVAALIISQIDNDQLESVRGVWEGALEAGSSTALQNVDNLKRSFTKLHGESSEEINLVLSPLYDSLVVLPNDWLAVQRLMRQSGLLDNLRELALQFEMHSSQSMGLDNIDSKRTQMKNEFSSLIHAELQPSEVFYNSPAIRSLAEKHRTRLPNLVVLGAKGAGKTFLYNQLARIGQWAEFVQQVIPSGGLSNNLNARMQPVTVPENLESSSQSWSRVIKPALQNALETEPDRSSVEWRNLWLDLMAWSAGYQTQQHGVGEDFLAAEETQNQRVVFIFDGLEDVFSDFYNNVRQQLALKTLIQDVLAYTSATPNSPIGVIVFIRKDIAQHAITQNFGQFVAKHADYELKWDDTEALRLICWLLKTYGIMEISDIEEDQLPFAPKDQLVKALYPLWGRKLGRDNSREAYSAKKVLELLANFNSELQSRDVVRFLAEAATQECDQAEQGATFNDRLLSPNAIKRAIPIVGRTKVAEIKEENRGNLLEGIIQKLEGSRSELRVPFDDTGLLSQLELNELMLQGLVRHHGGMYYMTPLFREGLELEQSSPGRARTKF